MSARLLVVDDDRAVRTALDALLTRRGDEPTFAESAARALDLLHVRSFDLVLTDVKMPGRSGIDLLRKVREAWPETPVVVMTGNASVEDAVAAMKAGAADYLVKPVSRDELFVVLDKALETRTLRAELAQLRRDVVARYGFADMVGTTPEMVRLYEDVTALADASATVLVLGPTGAGKDLVAHALHYRSRRATRPFVRVNCAAIPAPLVESELFGHERGAFTGAVRQHLGHFEQADGGTIFLDEVGELDPSAQAKLLRVLESGELQRVGGTEPLKVDVRVVAATNRDLRAEAEAGRFRSDLYYRLAVVSLSVPPLAARKADLPLLVDHLLRKLTKREDRQVPPVSPDTLARLAAYDWPGNVRELEHALERAVVLHRDGPWLEVDLPEHSPPPASPTGPSAVGALPPEGGHLTDALDAVERQLLLAALQEAGGVQARAAERLGLSKSNLGYRMRRLGIVRQGATFT